MSVDLLPRPQSGGQPLSDDDVIALARNAIEASREEIRRGRDGADPAELQQPGVTVDLGHKNIVRLPDEVVDIIKDEIERLAISHNRVTAFPTRLSECKRLRYLNVRYNQLKEVPKPILQLSALEILDISRNRLRTLPEEISNLVSLKVLAIQRNRIERLPLCLGDMISLRMLKLDENPLVFPPPEVWRPSLGSSTPAGAEAEAQTTNQIKKYLRQENSANATRQRLLVESDSELSEGAMETPRPPRAARTRFPVRPSLTSMDGLGIANALSPEAPPIPSRSHTRMRSSQNSLSSRPVRLSPPQVFTTDETANEITVRPKRHGIITPRVSEHPKLTLRAPNSPSLVSNGTSWPSFNSPGSRSSGAQADSSPAMTYIKEIGLSVYLSMQLICADLLPLYDSIRWDSVGNKPKTPIEFSELIRMIQELSQEHRFRFSEFERDEHMYYQDPNIARFVMQHAFEPLRNDVAGISRLAAMTKNYRVQIAWQCRSKAVYRSIYYRFYEVCQHLAVAAKLLYHLKSNPGEVYISTAGMHPLSLSGAGTISDMKGNVPGSFQGTDTAQSSALNSPNASATAFPTGVWTNNDVMGGTNRMQQPSTEDILFDNIITCLYAVVAKCNDGVGKIYSHLVFERQEIEALYGDSNAQIQALDNLIKLFSELMASISAMSKQLPVTAMKPELRDSADFWAVVRKPLRDWSTFLEQARSLNPSPIGGPIKGVTKTLHLAIKDASSAIANSPWTSAGTGISMLVPPATAISAASASAAAAGAGGLAHRKNPSGGSVPSTPLSAALGPAAQATMPAGAAATAAVVPVAGERVPGAPAMGVAGQRAQPPARINFFERVDRFERETKQAGQSAFGYGRR